MWTKNSVFKHCDSTWVFWTTWMIVSNPTTRQRGFEGLRCFPSGFQCMADLPSCLLFFLYLCFPLGLNMSWWFWPFWTCFATCLDGFVGFWLVTCFGFFMVCIFAIQFACNVLSRRFHALSLISFIVCSCPVSFQILDFSLSFCPIKCSLHPFNIPFIFFLFPVFVHSISFVSFGFLSSFLCFLSFSLCIHFRCVPFLVFLFLLYRSLRAFMSSVLHSLEEILKRESLSLASCLRFRAFLQCCFGLGAALRDCCARCFAIVLLQKCNSDTKPEESLWFFPLYLLRWDLMERQLVQKRHWSQSGLHNMVIKPDWSPHIVKLALWDTSQRWPGTPTGWTAARSWSHVSIALEIVGAFYRPSLFRHAILTTLSAWLRFFHSVLKKLQRSSKSSNLRKPKTQKTRPEAFSAITLLESDRFVFPLNSIEKSPIVLGPEHWPCAARNSFARTVPWRSPGLRHGRSDHFLASQHVAALKQGIDHSLGHDVTLGYQPGSPLIKTVQTRDWEILQISMFKSFWGTRIDFSSVTLALKCPL